MTDEQKIQLADIISAKVSEFMTSEDIPIMVGTLNKAQGIKGFDKAEVGHPVFEFKDRYILFLQSESAKTEIQISYYKDTLKPAINFL